MMSSVISDDPRAADRLHGIDAPESSQTCNHADGSGYRCVKDAASALDEFVAASRPIPCVEMNRDRYLRVVQSVSGPIVRTSTRLWF